ncbi:MAG: BatD family protein, partial [Bacteroidota bacterium]
MSFYKLKYFLSCVLISLLGIHSQVVKADTPFVASASSTTVAIGEQIQITFELSGDGRNFQAPNFANFSVLSGP